MTRKELIQSPVYWQEIYENECNRLDIPEKEQTLKIVKCSKRNKTLDDFVKWWWHA